MITFFYRQGVGRAIIDWERGMRDPSEEALYFDMGNNYIGMHICKIYWDIQLWIWYNFWGDEILINLTWE